MSKHFPNAHSYRTAAKIKCVPRARKRRYKPKERVSRFSMATDRALHRWWGDAQATGKILHGTYDEKYDWIGGKEDWPDWVSLEALATSVGAYTGMTVSKSVMASFMFMLGAHYEKYDAVRRNFRGRIIYSKTQRYYNVGPFRTRSLDTL